MTSSWETTESAFDLAAALLEARPGRDQMQLHKLLYLTQAASLAWLNAPLFDDRIEAWKYGPVIRGVAGHYMEYGKDPIPKPESGDSSRLSAKAKAIVDRIVDHYGDMTGPELAQLTKQPGSPWTQARGDLPADAHSDELIPIKIMTEYHRTHGVTPAEPPRHIADLAERFFSGDLDAIADLMEEATGIRPRVS